MNSDIHQYNLLQQKQTKNIGVDVWPVCISWNRAIFQFKGICMLANPFALTNWDQYVNIIYDEVNQEGEKLLLCQLLLFTYWQKLTIFIIRIIFLLIFN